MLNIDAFGLSLITKGSSDAAKLRIVSGDDGRDALGRRNGLLRAKRPESEGLEGRQRYERG